MGRASADNWAQDCAAVHGGPAARGEFERQPQDTQRREVTKSKPLARKET